MKLRPNVQPAGAASPPARPEPAGADWGTARPGLPARFLIGLSRRTVLGHSTGRKMLTRLLAKVHKGPVDDYVFGVPARLYPYNNVCERKALMRPDAMDPAEHALLATIMAAAPSVFVDIGANVGLYSLHAALASVPGGVILAVEPNPVLVDRFRFNLNLARRSGRVADRVTVLIAPVALSDHDGEGVLAAPGGEGTGRLGAEAPGQTVPIRQLLPLLREKKIERIDLMKIDIEGHEDRVLPGLLASDAERLWPRNLIIEHLGRRSWSVDCIELCLERGYRVARKLRGNTILTRDP